MFQAPPEIGAWQVTRQRAINSLEQFLIGKQINHNYFYGQIIKFFYLRPLSDPLWIRLTWGGR